MRKLIFLILITLFAAYAGWAERRPVGHYLSDLRSQVSVVQGQPGERGNLLAVQPELFTPDYQSAERLQLKFHAYLENARRQGLLNERTVVVFPEHVGTWLVASGEKPEVYAAADWPTAMDWMAASNPLKVARGWITARGDQRLTDTLFRMKAVDMAHDYQTLFGGLAHDFKVTVVAGSIVLPDPEVEDGELRPGTGQLYNVSLTFGPDGRPLGQPQRKVFPTRHELSYLNNGRGERLQVLDTPAGRLGVLIGTDSWYPDTYATLVEQRVELLAIPAALNQSGRWQQPWPGFDAELVPGDVRLAPTNQLRLSQASLALANAEHCPSTWNQMLELCNRELEQLTRTRSWRERVSRLLGPMLNGREPDLEEVAARLKLPTWTLRRKLAEEGTQFRSILNDTRRDLAMVYIRETDLAFGEIAYLLGFASAEAFQRAFKRWSGQTPGEFRRAQRQSA
ncbi:TPA: helix-turn-helix domain-containing protein [Pseudomonas aeruginosa]